jgi:O-Antigen ligase
VNALESIGLRYRRSEGPLSILDPEVHSRVTALAATAALAIAVGVGLTVSPLLTGIFVGAFILAAVIAWFDVLGVAVVLTATLPWLVVTSDVLPRLVLTFVTGSTAAAIWLVARPRNKGSHTSVLLRLGITLFSVPILISLAREGVGTDAIQAAKYVVFPMMVWVIAEATNSRDLVALRRVAFWSSFVAITFNLVLGLTGIANFRYYNSGETLGLASGHVLALLAGCVTAASFASSISLLWSPVIATGAIATVATGVRSTLPGLALAVIVRMSSAGVRLRVMALVAVAVAGVFVSGAAGVVEARFHKGERLGEFQSFANFGSGRGSIYEVALSAWWNSSPIEWIVGTGLRTIPKIEEQRLGVAFVGHSDAVEVGVQLGVVGLIGLLLMWWVAFIRAQSVLPLFVLASFALFSGVLEYGGPLVIGLLLATGLNAGREFGLGKLPRTKSSMSWSTPTVVQSRSNRPA